MVTAPSIPFAEAPLATCDADGSRFLMLGVSWEQYVAIRTTFEERAGLRLTYLEGRLKFTSPSHAHERYKKSVARLLELWAALADIDLTGFGSATFKLEEMERGLEPDECYFVGEVHPGPPDIAIEVALSEGVPIFGPSGAPATSFQGLTRGGRLPSARNRRAEVPEKT